MNRKLRRTMRAMLLMALLVVLALAIAGFLVRKELYTTFPDSPTSILFEIPHGLRARDIVGLLQEKKVIRNQYVALVYVMVEGLRYKLQAGEYLFDRPMTPIEVVTRIANGNVYLHKFTAPEGLTVAETAAKWEEQGFGSAAIFKEDAQKSITLIHDLDPHAETLEGYLFPETYLFPAHTTAHQAIESMVNRFRSVIQRLEKEVPAEQWPLDLRGTVILASIVESEAVKEEERPLVASVYLNRLGQKILLQCDPTVIYALERADRYKGPLTLADLKFQSPYNTYLNRGLPPGPIMNPGYPSLRATIQPASTKHLYFVRTVEGRHTFSDTLSAHNKAVAAYRALQHRSK